MPEKKDFEQACKYLFGVESKYLQFDGADCVKANITELARAGKESRFPFVDGALFQNLEARTDGGQEILKEKGKK